MLAHPETLESALVAAKSVGIPTENILLFGDQSVGGIQTVNQALLGGEELGTPYPYTLQQIKNDPTYLYFTSGTTGAKKAVIITQSMFITIMSIKDTIDSCRNTYTGLYRISSYQRSGMELFVCRFLQAFTAYVMPRLYLLKLYVAAIERYKISFCPYTALHLSLLL